MEGQPTFFNVSFNFDLGESANGGYPYRTININYCFFMKHDGTFVNTVNELNTTEENLLVVRKPTQAAYELPDLENFNNYPELFDPDNPDADRHRGQGRGQDIGTNEPYRITYVTRGELEHFSASLTPIITGGKRKKQTKRKRKYSKRRKY